MGMCYMFPHPYKHAWVTSLHACPSLYKHACMGHKHTCMGHKHACMGHKQMDHRLIILTIGWLWCKLFSSTMATSITRTLLATRFFFLSSSQLSELIWTIGMAPLNLLQALAPLPSVIPLAISPPLAKNNWCIFVAALVAAVAIVCIFTTTSCTVDLSNSI